MHARNSLDDFEVTYVCNRIKNIKNIETYCTILLRPARKREKMVEINGKHMSCIYLPHPLIQSPIPLHFFIQNIYREESMVQSPV